MLLLDEPSLGRTLVTREIFRIVGELNEKEGLTVLVVEQNAAIALEVASYAYVLEEWGRPCRARARARAQRVRPQELPGVLRSGRVLPALCRARHTGSIFSKQRWRSCSSTAPPA